MSELTAVGQYIQQEIKQQQQFSSIRKIQEIKTTDKTMKLLLLQLVETKVQTVPKELDLIVKESQVVQQDQPVTLNPNVGGFGQAETEVVLQDPARIYGYLALQ
jgi:apocytochrome f